MSIYHVGQESFVFQPRERNETESIPTEANVTQHRDKIEVRRFFLCHVSIQTGFLSSKPVGGLCITVIL